MTEPVVCPECDTTIWTATESGRYEEDIFADTSGPSGMEVSWVDHDEYEAEHGVWECENGHVGDEDIQDELEERLMNA